MLKGFIIEDEHLASTRLQKMLDTYKQQIKIIGKADRGTTAIIAIEAERPDVLFLDIQLPDMTYLVKPFRLERFKRAIEKLLKFDRLIDKKESSTITQESTPKTTNPFAFPIKLKDRILLIDYEDITHLKAEEKYIRIILRTGKSYLSDGTSILYYQSKLY